MNTLLMTHQKQKLISLLWGAWGLVFLMMIIGAATRITGSGLSMVTWRPITGILPPLSLEDWQSLFQEYQSSPEYLKVNQGMTLDHFKGIFWLEYIHRLWGRLIGLYFLIPLFIAGRDKVLRAQIFPQLLGIWCLGGLQGAVGWLMVKSGLIDQPHVSPYRLALHFMLALLTFFLIFIAILTLKKDRPFFNLSGQKIVLGILSLTLFYGVLVAGHKAGLMYNTFPLMGGHWIPEEAWFYSPASLNLLINPATVQWVHRWLAFVTLISILYFIFHHWEAAQSSFQKRCLILMGALGCLQIFLGVVTLMTQVSPLFAFLHHLNALVLLSITLLPAASQRA